MVFQSYALYPHMTVAENMGFALKLRGVNKTEIASKVREAAGLLDLEKYLDRKPKALSGGQRQRVAMGRAIVREPSVFLMDEPLSNLDAKLRVETRANIAELQARLGTTTVYVTHDQVEAMTMGHRVAVLKDGILQPGRHPADPVRQAGQRVRRRLHGLAGDEPADRAAGRRRRHSWATRPSRCLAACCPRRPAAGLKEVTFGVRPENITLGDQGIPVTIDLVEELGADAFVHGHTPDGNRLVIRADARMHPHAGLDRARAADRRRALPRVRPEHRHPVQVLRRGAGRRGGDHHGLVSRSRVTVGVSESDTDRLF